VPIVTNGSDFYLASRWQMRFFPPSSQRLQRVDTFAHHRISRLFRWTVEPGQTEHRVPLQRRPKNPWAHPVTRLRGHPHQMSLSSGSRLFGKNPIG
jgi:hypothetical protein